MLADSAISWLTPLLVIAAYGLLSYFKKTSGQANKNKVNWTPLESIGVTLFIYFGAQIIGVLLIYILLLAVGVSQDSIDGWLTNNIAGEFFVVLVVEALAFGLLVLFLKRRAAGLKIIGVSRPRLKDAGYILWGFLLYFALYTITIFIIDALSPILPDIDTDQKQLIGFTGAHGLQLTLVFISLVILPPIIEELIMRGFLYTGLKKGLPIIWAVIITSILFSLAHLQPGNDKPLLWAAAIDTFILSLILIYLREKTGGLSAPIGLHMLKNGIAFLSLFVFHLV